jgi:hypothetical protein
MAKAYVNRPYGVFVYDALTASDVGEAIQLVSANGSYLAIQAFADGGSGFNSGQISIEISLDAVHWQPLNDYDGNPLLFQSDGAKEIGTAFLYLRAVCDASVDDVDLYIRVISASS